MLHNTIKEKENKTHFQTSFSPFPFADSSPISFRSKGVNPQFSAKYLFGTSCNNTPLTCAGLFHFSNEVYRKIVDGKKRILQVLWCFSLY